MDIRKTRKAMGLTQTELGSELGISAGTISRFETGDLIPNARTLLALETLAVRHKTKVVQ